jgi:nucleoside-diphosphate-sugar epimerase
LETEKRVLITGLSGFTGRYVTAEMGNNGYEVFGIDSTRANRDENSCKVDLLDAQALNECVARIKPHAVIHLAGVAFVGHGDSNMFYEVNLIGTLNLLKALYEHAPDIESILLAGSANIYGNHTQNVDGKLGENTPAQPMNDYAVSKLGMEYMASLWMEKLPIFIVRPFNYTGVGQSDRFLIPKIVNHFKKRSEVIELGNLDVWREFNDVRTVAQIYRCLVEISPSPAGTILNVCTGRMYSLREVVSMAETLTGHSMHVRVNPAFVRESEVVKLCGDNKKLKEIINDWKDIDLKETLQWMLQN